MLNATCITPNNWRKKKLVEIIPSKSIINYSRNRVETELFDNKNITHSVSSSKVESLIKSKKIYVPKTGLSDGMIQELFMKNLKFKS